MPNIPKNSALQTEQCAFRRHWLRCAEDDHCGFSLSMPNLNKVWRGIALDQDSGRRKQSQTAIGAVAENSGGRSSGARVPSGGAKDGTTWGLPMPADFTDSSRSLAREPPERDTNEGCRRQLTWSINRYEFFDTVNTSTRLITGWDVNVWRFDGCRQGFWRSGGDAGASTGSRKLDSDRVRSNELMRVVK